MRVPASELKDVTASRRDRLAVRDALSLLQLSNPDRVERLAAVVKSGEGAMENNLPALELMEKTEKDAGVRKRRSKEAIALIQLGDHGRWGGCSEAAARQRRRSLGRCARRGHWGG